MSARSEGRRRRVNRAAETGRSRPDLRLVRPGDDAANAPARAMQADLASGRAFAGFEARWSARASLAFILATCGGFWLVVAALATALLRR